jgi:co-chaperonin GroES (HSP10)
MKMGSKRLIVVGDRVLVKQEDLEERTQVGLYLPQSVVEKEEVQGGRIVLTGPGLPLPEIQEEDEPWRASVREPRYLPIQAEPGDYALFLKKASLEVKFEGEKYLIVSHSSILVLMRDEPDILDQVGLSDEDLDL